MFLNFRGIQVQRMDQTWLLSSNNSKFTGSNVSLNILRILGRTIVLW